MTENLVIVLAAFAVMMAVLVGLYGVLCLVPDEAIERIARKVFGA